MEEKYYYMKRKNIKHTSQFRQFMVKIMTQRMRNIETQCVCTEDYIEVNNGVWEREDDNKKRSDYQ